MTLQLSGFSDSNWGSDPNDRKSTVGVVIYLGSYSVMWSSKKQTIISRPNTDAKYRALDTFTKPLSTQQFIFHIGKFSVMCMPLS